MQNNWGGPDSADKRDWFAGQVAEQFPSWTTPAKPSADQQQEEEPDAEYIEELLLQVMLDEFEVNVDDDSGFDIATEIVALRAQCAKGNFEAVDRLLERWTSRKGKTVVFEKGEDQEGEETDWDDTDGEGDEDEEMGEAPALVSAQAPKEKAEPEVDEDGFTKVTRKR